MFTIDRSIAWGDLKVYRRCPEFFRHRMTQGWEPPTAQEAISNALHAIAEHRGDLAAATVQVEQQIALVPDQDREFVRAQIAERAPKVVEAVKKEDPTSIREKVFRWLDPKSGWTLCAKPDRVEFVPQGRRTMMVISDYKDSMNYNRRKRDQLFFFALVLSRALNFNDKICCVVEYLPRGRRGQKVQLDKFFFSHWQSDYQLREVQADLEQIDRFLAADSFACQTGWYCTDCPLQNSCVARQQELARMASRNAVALPVVPVTAAMPVLEPVATPVEVA